MVFRGTMGCAGRWLLMKKSVLIVEDDPIIAGAMARLVEDNLDCSTTTAGSVAGAMALLDADVGFGILDVEVADGTSFPVATEFAHRHIPFIFVSASDPRQVPADLAGTPFFRKPIFPDHFLQVVRPYV
jgi:DNA-binding NtrC family response regulator